MDDLVLERGDRVEVRNFLSKTKRVKVKVGGLDQKLKVSRNPRGDGGSVDIACYTARKGASGPIVAAARINVPPYGGHVARAAVGDDLVRHTAYLQRQAAVGISRADLVCFIRWHLLQFRKDTLAMNKGRVGEGKPPYDFRYLLSLDDFSARSVGTTAGNVLSASNAVVGKTYFEAGALYGGVTRGRSGQAKYIDDDGVIRSVYRNGKNRVEELRRQGVQFVAENPKHRFVFVLALQGSETYLSWRSALPPAIKDPEDVFLYRQPRLLSRSGLFSFHGGGNGSKDHQTPVGCGILHVSASLQYPMLLPR